MLQLFIPILTLSSVAMIKGQLILFRIDLSCYCICYYLFVLKKVLQFLISDQSSTLFLDFCSGLLRGFCYKQIAPSSGVFRGLPQLLLNSAVIAPSKWIHLCPSESLGEFF